MDEHPAANRWSVVAGALIVQIILGTVYAFSIFVKPLQNEFGWDRATTQWAFSFALAAFALTMIPAGRLQDRIGPRIEADFYGDSPENKNALMLRHAYVEAPVGPLVLEAGQTGDLISPLAPSTLNYTVAWGAGNIGYRRPQVKLYQQAGGVYWGVALARNISGDLDNDKLADGETSGRPAVQCRLAFNNQRLTLGGSAHYGWCTCASAGDDYANWSLGGDLKAALHPRLSLLGEFYTGSNLGQYAGAIYNPDRVEGLRSSGGWINAQYQLAAPLALSAGGGVDLVRHADLEGVALARSGNAFLFVNGQYELMPGVRLGLEVSRWKTAYLNPSAAHSDTRLQWSVQGSF